MRFFRSRSKQLAQQQQEEDDHDDDKFKVLKSATAPALYASSSSSLSVCQVPIRTSESESDADCESMKQYGTNPSHRSRSVGSVPPPSRNNLATFRQLRCSMSYKNRHQHPASYRESHRVSMTQYPTSGAYDATTTPTTALQPPVSIAESDRRSVSSFSSHQPPRPLSEACVAALQTRRALQQMVLAMEDDEYDSDRESYDDYEQRMRRSSADSSTSSSTSFFQVGMDEYRRFQFRLRHLEDLCQEQARKQSQMEATIEQEVEARTQKMVEVMDKKMAMYKQAKDAECEREVQRRIAEVEQRLSASFGSSSRLNSPSTKPLDRIFRPRKSLRRRRNEYEAHHHQREKEMEQFRAFLRNTADMSQSKDEHEDDLNVRAASESLKALNDPHISDDLVCASRNELIEMICVLRKHVSVQEEQLDQAKALISAALEAREQAEATAVEAVELSMQLDARLERASQEMVGICDELRRSASLSSTDLTARLSQCSSFLSRSSLLMNGTPGQATSLSVSGSSNGDYGSSSTVLS